MVSAEHETQTLNIVDILFFLKNTTKPNSFSSKILIFTQYQLIDMYISQTISHTTDKINVNVEELKL